RAVRALAALAAVVLAAAVGARAAQADGDPASDYLLLQTVFFPTPPPSQSAETALDQAAAAVYAHGDRIKVAVIDSVDDLGAIPSLFGHPSDYARFLGIELGLWYVGPLLVVMPNGYGIYDGGHSTAPEQQVLQGVALASDGPDQLARSATAALQKLEAAGALHSPDTHAPLATAYPAGATLGRTATLHFDLFDDSGLTTPMAFAIGTRHASVRWPVPHTLRSRRLRFCVVASDPSGNRSKPSCAL